MIQQIFHIVFQSLELEQSIKFGSIDDRFKNIELIPLGEKKHKLILDNEDSVENANSKVNEFIDRISLLDSHQVSSFQYIGASVDNGMSANLTGTSTLSADLTAKISDPSKFYNLYTNKKALTNTNNSGAVKVYRHSLNIKDDISKYLIYYGLLQILVSDSQKDLEDYIKQKLPTIEILKRIKMFKGNEVEVEETIITRTRNLIAHPNNTLDLNALKQEVIKNITALRQLVLNILRDS